MTRLPQYLEIVMAFFKEKEGIFLDPLSHTGYCGMQGHFGLPLDFSSNLFSLTPDGNHKFLLYFVSASKAIFSSSFLFLAIPITRIHAA